MRNQDYIDMLCGFGLTKNQAKIYKSTVQLGLATAAQQLGLSRKGVRRLAWQNLATIVQKTNTQRLLPELLVAKTTDACQETDHM